MATVDGADGAAHPVSQMLRLFRDGATRYQPAIQGFDPETGDPQPSIDNIQRLRKAGLVLADFRVKPTGTLVIFATGEQYYAPGLRVGTNGLATKALAHFAAQADYGPEEELLELYKDLDLPENISGTQLVNLNMTPLARPRR